jgi:thiamine biosynthesis lipoprotein
MGWNQRRRFVPRCLGRLRLALVPVALLPACTALSAADEAGTVEIRREGVLGTSLDMKVRGAPRETADLAAEAAMAEIERLAGLLDMHRPETEISRLNVAPVGKPFPCSADLFAVLGGGEKWRLKTDGAFNANVGELLDLWKAAGKSGKAPQEDRLQNAAAAIQGRIMDLDPDARTVTPRRRLHLTAGCIGKGYIIHKALAAAKAAAPKADGILVCIGGDMAFYGAGGRSEPWTIAVADPKRASENEKPLALLSLRNRGVSTSGNYERYVTVGGKRHSHIIDPKTGQTADTIISATVVADDVVTSDVLATALSVMGPKKGLALIRRLNHVECLLVDASGRQYASDGWAAMATTEGPSEAPPAPAASGVPEAAVGPTAPWPAGYKVTLTFTLGAAGRVRGYKRPYLAAWIEDSAGKYVTTLSVWGSKEKWRRDLTSWYRLGAAVRAQAKPVTRASRPAGQYSLAWDGKDAAGRPVKKGTYTVRLEINREDAGHVNMKAAIDCGDKPAKAAMPANGECSAAAVTYGPGGTAQ